ncbi:MAG: UbiH/UbiF/VisC/COQ6 family ubiquinone biosynthesis hydroxylase [Woeseiaceae bacterium]
MKRPFHIVIVGAGIVGLALAARLAQGSGRESLRLTVVDAADRPLFSADDDVSLRVSAIAGGSSAFLQSLGAWQRIEESRLSPYECMRVWDESDGPESPSALCFEAAEFAVPQLGFIVENTVLREALLQQLEAADVELMFGSPIRSLQAGDTQYAIEFEDGIRRHADLIIGADGVNSFVRTAVGIEVRRWSVDQTAFVTHLACEHGHQATAWQRFTKDGPLGILPLFDGRVSVVWSTRPDVAKAALGASDEVLGEMLMEASDYVLGTLSVAGPRGAFPLGPQHAERYVLPRVALVGDAAHAIHPLAGQGANLGLQDAEQLAEVIEAALDQGLYPGDLPVLRRYERSRKGANATMLHFTTGLNRLFTTDSRLVAELRMVGMRLFNRSGPIRERAVKVALGVS